jgi:hypothetical protein
MKAHEGYIMIDHRASPGTPDVPGGTLLEAAMLQCAHCNSFQIKNPGRTRDRADCMKCGYMYVCDNCAIEMRKPDYVHKTYQQKNQEFYDSTTSKVNYG